MREPGVWDFPDDTSVAESGQDGRQRDLNELRQRGVADDDLEALAELLDANEGAFPCLHPSLLHGDFLPGHLFVDDALRLRGVIDFGDFGGGVRIGDLANLQSFGRSIARRSSSLPSPRRRHSGCTPTERSAVGVDGIFHESP